MERGELFTTEVGKQTRPGSMNLVKSFSFSVIFLSLALVCTVASEKEGAKATEEGEEVKVDEEKLSYAKGSLCGYCDYCKVILYYRPLE